MQRSSAAVLLSLLAWGASSTQAHALDEFAPDKGCAPVRVCVKHHKGEPGQLGGRCAQWGHIFPCGPVRAPEKLKSLAPGINHRVIR